MHVCSRNHQSTIDFAILTFTFSGILSSVTWLASDMNNNKMERLNEEIRDREKVMRGLKTKDTPISTGYQIFHNYIRAHQGSDGKTPAEECGIDVKGKNKWKTLIQNASQGKS